MCVRCGWRFWLSGLWLQFPATSFQLPASTSDKKTLRSVCLSDQPSLYLAYFAFVLNHNTHIYILVLANLSNPLRCPTNPFFPRRWFICTPLLFLCGSSSAHRRGSMGGWVLDWMVGWVWVGSVGQAYG